MLKNLKNVSEKREKRIFLIHMKFEKSINSFKMKKKDRSPDYLWGSTFFWWFVNNFLTLLLCKIYVFDIFNIVDFFF